MKDIKLLVIPTLFSLVFISCGNGNEIDFTSSERLNFEEVKKDKKKFMYYKHKPFTGKVVKYEGEFVEESIEAVDGLKDGESCKFDSKGRLYELVTYTAGEKTGPCEMYYRENRDEDEMTDEDLPIMFEGNYTDGDRTGKWVAYKPDGTVLKEIEDIEKLKDEEKYKIMDKVQELAEKYRKK